MENSEEKKVGIITFEQFQGKRNIGSTRIRIKWPLKHWPEAEEFIMGRKYETFIFQKAYWLEGMEELDRYAPNQHIKILDICDADWLHWGYRIKQILDTVDAVTTSTIQQAEFLTKYTDKPIWCIPDRLELELFDGIKKEHEDKRADTAVWYGYSENFPMLDSAIGALVTCGIKKLIVIANARNPYQLPAGFASRIEVSNLPWTEETYLTDILKGDLVINPKSDKGRWKYKSNNKTINAWALGMPVAHDQVELKALIDPVARKEEAEMRYKMAHEEYNVIDSVAEFRALIAELKQQKGLV